MLQPLMIQTGMISQQEADDLYQQALTETLSDGFNCIWYYLTVWAKRA
jgi:hypothetical protein